MDIIFPDPTITNPWQDSNAQWWKYDGDAWVSFDPNEEQYLQWKGLWTPSPHNINDVVRENYWLGTPNKLTADHLEPQPMGAPEDSLDPELAFNSGSEIAVIKMVHRYITEQDGYFQGLYIKAPFFDINTVCRVTIIDNISSEAVVNNNVLLSPNQEWTLVNISNAPIFTGKDISVVFEYYNANSAQTVEGEWECVLGAGVPAVAKFNMDNLATPTIIFYSHTDANGADRTTELQSILVDSTIQVAERGDASRNIEMIITSVDITDPSYTTYGVNVISNGAKDIRGGQACSSEIDIPVTQPSEYYVESNYYPSNNPSWATISSEFYLDGVQQVSITNAYAIRLVFQQAYVSPDWDFMAYSGGAGGGSSSSSSSTTMIFQDAKPLESLYENGQEWMRTVDMTKYTLYVQNDGASRYWVRELNDVSSSEPIAQSGIAPYVDGNSWALPEGSVYDATITGGNFDDNTTVTAVSGITVNTVVAVNNTELAVNFTTLTDLGYHSLLVKNGTLEAFGGTLVIEVLSDTTVSAKSVVFDFHDNYGDTYVGVRSIEFKSKGAVIDMIFANGDFTSAHSSWLDAVYKAQYVFDTGKSKTGSVTGNNGWLGSSAGGERLTIAFTTPQLFDEIIINNFHNSGVSTTSGVKGVTVTISDDSISDTTYNAVVSNSTVLSSVAEWPQHVASDIVDDQKIYPAL